MEIISNSPEETKAFAKSVCERVINLGGPLVVELVGDLGAGKTTFMKGVGEFLGVQEDIISPTFLIQRNYKIGLPGNFKKLVHIDAYRLEKPEELETIDWETYSSDPQNLIFIEWPANMQTDLAGALRVEFFHEGDSVRRIKFSQ